MTREPAETAQRRRSRVARCSALGRRETEPNAHKAVSACATCFGARPHKGPTAKRLGFGGRLGRSTGAVESLHVALNELVREVHTVRSPRRTPGANSAARLCATTGRGRWPVLACALRIASCAVSGGPGWRGPRGQCSLVLAFWAHGIRAPCAQPAEHHVSTIDKTGGDSSNLVGMMAKNYEFFSGDDDNFLLTVNIFG